MGMAPNHPAVTLTFYLHRHSFMLCITRVACYARDGLSARWAY
jgi:hypothetical protein